MLFFAKQKGLIQNGCSMDNAYQVTLEEALAKGLPAARATDNS